MQRPMVAMSVTMSDIDLLKESYCRFGYQIWNQPLRRIWRESGYIIYIGTDTVLIISKTPVTIHSKYRK